jgi:tRNA A37 threonylcarbamoyladenosine dehydratase
MKGGPSQNPLKAYHLLALNFCRRSFSISSKRSNFAYEMTEMNHHQDPDQFSRTRMLLGAEAIERLGRSHVAVFGVGGVGGYVVEVLARSGVGQLDLYDNDDVDITNLNRQIIALHSTLGQPKVEVARQRVLDINPDCQVTAHQMFYLPENADDVDLTAFDYVVDCIDTVTAKLELIRRCHAAGVPLICSMGAANKMDPTAFRVADITKTNMDPLAKVIRKKLRKLGIPHLKVVYSDESPMKPIASPASAAGSDLSADSKSSPSSSDNKGQTKSSRRSVPASNAFVPAAAGLVIGGEVIKQLILPQTEG